MALNNLFSQIVGAVTNHADQQQMGGGGGFNAGGLLSTIQGLFGQHAASTGQDWNHQAAGNILASPARTPTATLPTSRAASWVRPLAPTPTAIPPTGDRPPVTHTGKARRSVPERRASSLTLCARLIRQRASARAASNQAEKLAKYFRSVCSAIDDEHALGRTVLAPCRSRPPNRCRCAVAKAVSVG